MNDASLPTETLVYTIESLISEDPRPNPEKLYEARYISRSYLTPILRVSKRWYTISVKCLYQSVGSDEREIAEALYRTLEANPHTAALVERLHLGIECNIDSYFKEHVRTNTNILKLCPNVKRVERSADSTARDSMDLIIRKAVEHISKLSDPAARVDPRTFTGCCPDLREIVIYRAHLHPSEYASLRAMCSGGVTKFAASLLDLNATNRLEGKVDALCECLRARSPTLEHLKIDVHQMNYLESYRPLDEAIATSKELRQLLIGRMKLDFGSILNLLRLKRFACLSRLTEDDFSRRCGEVLLASSHRARTPSRRTT